MIRRALPAIFLTLAIPAVAFVLLAPHAGSAGIGTAGAPAAATPSGWMQTDPPAGAGAMAPSLTVSGKDLLLTWLEPMGPANEPTGHQLRVSRLAGGRWSAPVTVVSGPGFFANWADFPALAEAPDGSLTAHWLAKTGSDTYAYGIYLAHSKDRGATWSKTGMLHEDKVPAEHGFVSWVAEKGGLRAFWLDGRETPKGGAMTMRTTLLKNGTAPAGERVDDRVCDCCQTDAALAETGPVVAFRDRTPKEVRDIYVVRRTASGWSKPVAVHADNWQIPGCPVNGPAIAAAGKRVAVAWFTGVPTPRVQLAFSEDGGARFGKPVLIDGGKPLGRVDLLLDAKGDAVVSWMALEGEGAAVRLRRVTPQGKPGSPVTLAATSAARGSGFPRMALLDGRLHLAWVEEGETSKKVKLGSLPVGALKN